MLNSFGRLLIWLGVAAFVAPLIMTAVVLTKTTFALNSAFSKLDEAGEIGTTLSKSEIKQRTPSASTMAMPHGALSSSSATRAWPSTFPQPIRLVPSRFWGWKPRRSRTYPS